MILLNRLKLYLISLLINLSCEPGQIMIRYDFLEVRQVILFTVEMDFNFTSNNCSYELQQIMTRVKSFIRNCTL